MGIYQRGKTWWITYFVGGRQKFESSRSTKKSDARKLLDIRKGAAREGRLRLIKSKAPHFDDYARRFLLTVLHPNTQKRYRSSVRNLEACIGKMRLSDIRSDAIEDFKEKRLSDGVRTATVNRDLAVLRRMMKLAERKMLINESPFRNVEFLEERKQRRRPHILTYEEEDRLLAAALPHIRALTVLILETGMRSKREALSLLWGDVDFVSGQISRARVEDESRRAHYPNLTQVQDRASALAELCRTGIVSLRVSKHA